MSLSLVDAQRDIILKALKKATQDEAEWRCLVLDEKSRKIIDNVIELDTLLSKKITYTEELEKQRSGSTDTEAIYLLTPRTDVFDRLLHDLQNRIYPRFHLIWTSIPQESHRKQLIETETLRSLIRSYQVLNIEYFPQESHLVTFRDPWETTYLFHPLCAGLIKKHVEDIAQKIVGVCVALGEYPIIRFYQPRPEVLDLITAARSYKTTQPSREFRFLVESLEPLQWSCQMLARFVQDELDLYAKFHTDFPPPNTRPRAVLYIADRTIDVIAPLLHEFTYQAMIFDLLPIYTGDKLQYKTVVNEGRPDEQVKMEPIEETDQLWLSYRHKHMKETLDGINDEFKKYMASNSVFTKQNQGGEPSINQIKRMMAGLPQYQEQKDKYSLHLGMMEMCMKMFEDRNLSELAMLEQTLGNGLDADDRKPKNVADQLIRLLDDSKVVPLDRLRLLTLYMLFKDGLLPADLEKLIAHAKIQHPKIGRVQNFDLLGWNSQRRLKENRTRPAPVFPTTPPLEHPETYALGRYKTTVERLLTTHGSSKVDDDLFPYTRPPLDDGGGGADEVNQAAATSLRTAKATWAAKRSKATNENKQRVLVYMAAGATYSESKACYDASKTYGKEVVLITSHMLSTDLYLRQIGHLTESISKLEPPRCMQAMHDRSGASRPQYNTASQSYHRSPPPPRQRRPSSSSASFPNRQSGHSSHSAHDAVPMASQQMPPPLPRPVVASMNTMTLNGNGQPQTYRPVSNPNFTSSDPGSGLFPPMQTQASGLYPPMQPVSGGLYPPLQPYTQQPTTPGAGNQKLDKKATKELEKAKKEAEKAEKKKNKTGFFGGKK